mmetsp:Transcript_32147/g.69489  ORF Transcript_32147/g.69489 Transcript_32147/m.69489 type:complete len:239 (+) Transcript_32147:1400-2116(+)
MILIFLRGLVLPAEAAQRTAAANEEDQEEEKQEKDGRAKVGVFSVHGFGVLLKSSWVHQATNLFQELFFRLPHRRHGLIQQGLQVRCGLALQLLLHLSSCILQGSSDTTLKGTGHGSQDFRQRRTNGTGVVHTRGRLILGMRDHFLQLLQALSHLGVGRVDLGGGADDAPHLIHEAVGDGGIQGLRNFFKAIDGRQHPNEVFGATDTVLDQLGGRAEGAGEALVDVLVAPEGQRDQHQ